jgi:hypothetical protein
VDHFRHPHLRERGLTLLVVLETIGLFLVAPLAEKGAMPIALSALLVAAVVVCVVVVVWGSRLAAIALAAGAAVELAATIIRIVRPSARTEALDFAAGLLFSMTLIVVIGIAVFRPGRVSIHRVLGAIAIYLNVAVTFALAYRVIDSFSSGAFAGSHGALTQHSIGTLIYFSFSTLTTSGYGDIVPVDPLARSAANLEAVIGQLFPATLLARLVTLQLQSRRPDEQ